MEETATAGAEPAHRTDDLDALLRRDGYYAPPGSTDPTPAQAGGAGEGVRVDTAEACSTLLLITFELIAARKGAHWKMDEAEAREAGKAYGALLDKYYPDMQLGPEAAAVTVTAMIFLPRVAMDKALAEEKGRRDAEAELREHNERGANLDGELEPEGGADAGEA